jgi:hypothetical protein
MQTLDQWLRSLLRRSARDQSSVRNGAEIVFPLCWQMKTVTGLILLGCGFLLFAVITQGRRVPGDPWCVVVIPFFILVPLLLAIMLLLPGQVVIDSMGIRQRRWWRRENSIPWNDVSSVVRSRDDGSTIVYGKFESPITFSPYLVDQPRFDTEVRARTLIEEIRGDL